MGFPEGIAEKMVLNAFHSFPYKYNEQISNNKKYIKKEAKKIKENEIRYNSNGKQIPINNGGTTNEYTFTQSLTDLSISFNIPSNINVKDIIYKPTSTHLYLSFGDKIIDKDWYYDVEIDNISWCIHRELNQLEMEIEKSKNIYWPTIFKGDKEIDLTEINDQRPISSYDKNTQRELDKIMV